MYNKLLIQKILLVLLSSILTVYFINMGLELWHLSKKNVEVHTNIMREIAKRGNKYDSRYLRDVIFDERNKGQNCVASLCPRTILRSGWNNKILPLSGIPNTRTIFCNETGYFSEYLSDRYGFNNPDQSWETFINNELDFILLGDSIVHGACVAQEHSIAGHMRKAGYSTLSFGCLGNGSLSNLSVLREYGSMGKVKNVAYIFTVFNDILDMEWEEKSILNKYFEDDNFTQSLPTENVKNQTKSDLISFHENALNTKDKDKIVTANTIKSRLSRTEIDFEIMRLLKLTHVRKLLFGREDPLSRLRSKLKSQKLKKTFLKRYDEKVDKFFNVVKKMRDISQKQNANFIFIYLNFIELENRPQWHLTRFIHDNYKDKIFNRLNREGIAVVDLEESFREVEDQSSLYPLGTYKDLGIILNTHFSSEGYKVIGNEIIKAAKF